MKTKINLLLILLLAGLTVSSQVEKGSCFLNGLNIASFQSGKTKVSYGTYDSKSNFSTFVIGPMFLSSHLSIVSAPTLNYAFTNQISGGITLLLSSDISKTNDNKSKMSVFMIGPSLRYYLMKEKKFLPFVEGKAGIGNVNSKYDDEDADKTKLSGWYLGTGATYFFLPKTGIDLTLGYQSFTNKDKDSDTDSKSTINGINFGIGILVDF